MSIYVNATFVCFHFELVNLLFLLILTLSIFSTFKGSFFTVTDFDLFSIPSTLLSTTALPSNAYSFSTNESYRTALWSYNWNMLLRERGHIYFHKYCR